jgi:enoyl-CoA hydratase
MTRELLTHTHGRIGHISLNRPKALHALTQGMCEEMARVLLGWRSDDAIDAVILDHAEGRGFCAGGDIQVLRAAAEAGDPAPGRAFFAAEYRLNHLLFTFPKPVVAFMDGVTMGGGVGIALPARFRVATPNTLFAMPEARLDGAECLWAGLATHYLAAESLAAAKARIVAGEEPEAVLDALNEPDVPPARLAGNAGQINRLFAPDTLEGIIVALQADDSEWAAKELKAVRGKAPLASKVALRLLAEGAVREDFAEEMRSEFRIASRMCLRPDFVEGVRAVLVEKDNAPRWDPTTPDGVTDAMLDAIFAPLPEGEEWVPIG